MHKYTFKLGNIEVVIRALDLNNANTLIGSYQEKGILPPVYRGDILELIRFEEGN